MATSAGSNGYNAAYYSAELRSPLEGLCLDVLSEVALLCHFIDHLIVYMYHMRFTGTTSDDISDGKNLNTIERY
ncbi:hypothetical protein An03g00700 [Aspergillus niger]|uniref:Uncharacterized protein n=2 Tax=Aspergillus niger TaxID=5061 RepID=A2QFT5_ASPNC|nr:hypothetical protein An03g00700 [Aspergillus niger]CAK38045.1 hypothetical protein An03g00700 [Aspergillus niger]